MTTRFVILFVLLSTMVVQGQSIFEEETSENTILQNEYYSLNGDFSGFGQYINGHSGVSPYYYGAGSLKLRTLQTSWSNFYANFRFTYGSNSGSYFSIPDLREAYLDLYLGNFDLRLGKQIINWGKADGMNPTDNITPKDYTFRSPDIDDSRMGNYVAQIKYHMTDNLGIEASWVPFYRASVLPLEVVPLPENVNYAGEADIPGGLAGSSSYAVKFNYSRHTWDGSISYYNGLETDAGFAMAGIDYSNINMPEVSFKTQTFRKQVIGGDFSTSLGSYGLRAEAAYTHTGNEYLEKSWISNPSLDLVVGTDFSIGGIMLIAEYSTKYVFDFTSLSAPADPRQQLNYELELYNRMFSRQTHELSHTVLVRPSYSFLYDTMLAEVATQYNFTTGELAVMPKLTYRFNDSIALNLGTNIYLGGENTLFNLIGDSYGGPFLGISISF